MKIDISKWWLAYISFVWGLWVAVICCLIDGAITWNMGFIFIFILHIMANILVLWLSVVREESLEEEE